MKITILGSQLQNGLQAQLERMAVKRLGFSAYMTQHTATHGERPNSRQLCAQELQAQMLYNSMDAYERKMRAAIAAIDPSLEYEISMKRYLNSYIACPYDSIVIPEDPAEEVEIRDFHVN
jgi:hypothetical protein